MLGLLVFESAAETHTGGAGLLDYRERGASVMRAHVLLGMWSIAWASNEIRYRGIA